MEVGGWVYIFMVMVVIMLEVDDVEVKIDFKDIEMSMVCFGGVGG